MKKTETTFIINNHSGTATKNKLPEWIKSCVSTERFDVKDIIFTAHAGHAQELAKKAVAQKRHLVVAVGGDGTVNEIANELIDTNTALAIIPMGSGNGLARHLRIPLKPKKALQHLNTARFDFIDTAFLNDRPFWCTAGGGFDAVVTAAFNQKSGRGFWSYARCALVEWFRYKAPNWSFHFGQKEKVFMLTIANASQFGNNAHISPLSNIQDGMLELCVLKDFPFWQLPILLFRTFTRTIHRSPYMKVIEGTHFSMQSAHPVPVHIDGEPIGKHHQLDISISPISLKVLV